MKKLFLLLGCLIGLASCQTKKEEKEPTGEELTSLVSATCELVYGFQEYDVIRAFTTYSDPYYYTDLVYMVEGATDKDNKLYKLSFISIFVDGELQTWRVEEWNENI